MSPRSIATLVIGITLAAASPAAAQPDARRDAARAFSEGTRAFDAGDYTRAAQSFETAYTLAPHEDALWNAARAWQRAGELPRAANAYAHYLREAPANAQDRAGATAALKTLATKLGRLEVHVGAGIEGARLDDTPITTDGSVYVLPGVHVLRGTTKRGPIEQQQVVKEGEATSVVLAAPAEATAPATASPSEPPAREADARDRSRPTKSGWSPVVVWIGGGLTIALAGVATWSGIDTLDALHGFEATPTQERLDSGRGKQLRTNVLIGGAVGLALLTGVAAVWLVDWGGEGTRVGLGAGPGGIGASGSF